MKQEVQNWLKQAREDLDTAKYLLDGKKYKQCSFYSQQAAEKGLKGLLILKTRKLIKIHDLVKLAKEVDLDEKLISSCEKLNAVYIDSRYPDIGHSKYTRKEAEDDVAIAEKVLEWIEKNI